MVTPQTTALSIVKTTSGTTGSLTNEAMSELDWSSLGYAAHTVYQITSTSKRYLSKAVVPTFTIDDGGGADPLTPLEIQYPGGIIILSAPTAGTETVVCASGTYYTTSTPIIGGQVARVTTGPNLVDVTSIGNVAVARYPVVKDFSVTLDTFAVKTQASYTTALGGSNDDLVFTHLPGGTAGNSITITYHDPNAASQSLGIVVASKAVTVNLATNSGKTITTKASDIRTAVHASADCRTLGLGAEYYTGNDGSGVVTAMSVQSLSGGVDLVDQTAKFGITLIIEIYFSTSADSRLEGYCYLESLDDNFDPKDVIKETLSFKGNGCLYFRPS
jgi:hypothetical protein